MSAVLMVLGRVAVRFALWVLQHPAEVAAAAEAIHEAKLAIAGKDKAK